MKAAQTVGIVAAWEFRRFFKIKDMLIGLAVTVVLGLVGYLVVRFVDQDAPPAKLAVLEPSAWPFPWSGQPLPEPVREDDEDEEEKPPPWTVVDTSAVGYDELRERLGRRELDGILQAKADGTIELEVMKEPRWRWRLEASLSAARQQAMVQREGLTPQRLAEVLAPATVTLAFHPKSQGRSRNGDEVAATIVIIIMIMGVWISLAYLFVGITSEKTQRVTEQVVAAISPQSWIDGKLLGLTAGALATVLLYGVGMILVTFGLKLGGLDFELPSVTTSPGKLAAMIVLAALGMAFWNTFIGAIAATINDPNTSARGGLIMLPILPCFVAFAALGNPDSLGMRVMSLVPGFSSTILSARLALTEVAWWEVPAAVVLLILAVAVARRVAGKVFGAAILMYGKEPSIREIWRWVRAA